MILILLIFLIVLINFYQNQSLEKLIYGAIGYFAVDEFQSKSMNMSINREDSWGLDFPTYNLDNGQCGCGCLENTNDNGYSWDYSTGNLSNDGKFKEMVELCTVISDYFGNVPVFLPWASAIEESGGSLKNMRIFTDSECRMIDENIGSIYNEYLDIWPQSRSKSRLDYKRDIFHGDLSKIPTGTYEKGNAMTPFQFETFSWKTWVKLCPDFIFRQLDVEVWGEIERNETGHPLYAPDAIYGKMMAMHNIENTCVITALNKRGVIDKYDRLSEKQKGFVSLCVYRVSYAYPGKCVAWISDNSGIAEWICDLAYYIDGIRNDIVPLLNKYGDNHDYNTEILIKEITKLIYGEGNENKYIQDYKDWIKVIHNFDPSFSTAAQRWKDGLKMYVEGQLQFEEAIEKAGGIVSDYRADFDNISNDKCRCDPSRGCCNCNNSLEFPELGEDVPNINGYTNRQKVVIAAEWYNYHKDKVSYSWYSPNVRNLIGGNYSDSFKIAVAAGRISQWPLPVTVDCSSFACLVHDVTDVDDVMDYTGHTTIGCGLLGNDRFDFLKASKMQPGDIVVTLSGGGHAMVIVDVRGNEITIIHSSCEKVPMEKFEATFLVIDENDSYDGIKINRAGKKTTRKYAILRNRNCNEAWVDFGELRFEGYNNIGNDTDDGDDEEYDSEYAGDYGGDGNSGDNGEFYVVIAPGHSMAGKGNSSMEPMSPHGSDQKAKWTSGTTFDGNGLAPDGYTKAEGSINRYIGYAVSNKLSMLGVRNKLLDTNDYDKILSNKQRAEEGNRADLVLTIHFDASDGGAFLINPEIDLAEMAKNKKEKNNILGHYDGCGHTPPGGGTWEQRYKWMMEENRKILEHFNSEVTNGKLGDENYKVGIRSKNYTGNYTGLYQSYVPNLYIEGGSCHNEKEATWIIEHLDIYVNAYIDFILWYRDHMTPYNPN